jgi:ABC-type transport system involved in cytochrome c biogenesis permease component
LLVLNRRLRRLSVETGMSPRQIWWWRIFCRPTLFVGLFKRVNRGLMNRNPIGWLQRRTWTARLATWGWLGVLVAVETFLVTFNNQVGAASWNDLMEVQPWLALFLGVGAAFSAADSFRQERETGALELLLVTPLSVAQVIRGRLFGLWGQYLPVFVLLLATWWYTASWQLWRDSQDLMTVRTALAMMFFSTFAFLPVIGLQQSLRRKHFFTAWLATVALGLGFPIMVPFMGGYLFAGGGWFGITGISLQVAGLQALAAGWSLHCITLNLNQREFAMAK